MKDYRYEYSVEGTSAMKPDCSRYSNENERIIGFPGADSGKVDYRKLSHARHATSRTRISATLKNSIQDNETIQEFKSGGLKGTPIEGFDTWKVALGGGVYSLMAIAALFISL